MREPSRWRLGLAICSVLLVGAVTLHGVSAVLMLSLYAREQAVRLDPFGLDVYADARPPGKRPRVQPLVVFFGDARALGWPAPAELSRFRFLNRGIGFQTSAQIRGRLQRDLLLDGGDGKVRAEYADDYIHVNEAGYAALNRALGPLLRRLAPAH